MGTDSRIKNLEEVGREALASLISTLVTVLDDPTYSVPKKIKLLTLLKRTAVVASDSAKDYEAVTPKSLLLTLASITNLGIVQFPTDAEIEAKTVEKALTVKNLDKISTTLTSKVYTVLIGDIDGSSNVVANWVAFRFWKNGNLIFYEGYIEATPNSVVDEVYINLNNCPLPINSSFNYGYGMGCFSRFGISGIVPMAVQVKNVTGKLQLLLKPMVGYSFTTVVHGFRFGAYYIAE